VTAREARFRAVAITGRALRLAASAHGEGLKKFIMTHKKMRPIHWPGAFF
jgi:hypothetical protein